MGFSRKSFIAAGVVMMITSCTSHVVQPGDGRYFISTQGNDSWTGRFSEPNKALDDGPFKSFEKCRDEIRRARKSGELKGGAKVFVRGGNYHLKSAFILESEDSGIAESPLVISSYPGEKVLVSGGQRIDGFKERTAPEKNNMRIWEVNLPEVAAGNWNFTQLFVNGERRYRPRLPKEGYLHIKDEIELPKDAKDRRQDRFRFSSGDMRSDWRNFSDVELLVFHTWSMSRYNPLSIEADTVILKGHSPSGDSWGVFKKGNRYLVENVAEAFGSQGEWYLDRKSGLLSYLPKDGEVLAKSEVVAPRLVHLVELKGDTHNKKWVQNISFRGISFAHTNWTLPAD